MLATSIGQFDGQAPDFDITEKSQTDHPPWFGVIAGQLFTLVSKSDY